MPSYTVLVATLCLAAVAADLVIAVAGRKLLATAAPWPMELRALAAADAYDPRA